MENQSEFRPPRALPRFERMVKLNETRFFDASDLEEIIEFYMANRNFQQANHAIRFAMNLHPQSSHFLLRYYQILCFNGKFKKARRIIKYLEKVEPGNPEVLISKAQYFNLQGNNKKALSLLLKALEMDNRNHEVWYFAAVEAQNLGFYNKAIRCFRKAVQLQPSNESYLAELYTCFELNASFENGIKYFKRYLDHFPYSALAWDFLGALYFKVNQFEKAIDAHDFALAIDDKMLNAILGRAFSNVALERYEDAISDFEKASELKLPDDFTLLCMGECYEQMDDYDSAEKCYKSALEENSSLVDAYSGLAMVHHYKGNTKEAISLIKQAINLEPGEGTFWFLLGDFYLKSGMLEKGEEAYLKVIELDPHNADIWYHIIQLYIDRGDYETALGKVIESLVYTDNEPRVMLQWAEIMMYKGENDASLYLFEEALEYDMDIVSEYLITFKNLSENPKVKNILNQFKSPQVN